MWMRDDTPKTGHANFSRSQNGHQRDAMGSQHYVSHSSVGCTGEYGVLCVCGLGVLCAQPSQVGDARVLHGRGLAQGNKLQPIIHTNNIYLIIITLREQDEWEDSDRLAPAPTKAVWREVSATSSPMRLRARDGPHDLGMALLS